MAKNLVITQRVQEGDEYLFNESLNYAAEGYDVVDVVVEAGAEDMEIELVTGDAVLFAIRASGYEESGSPVLSYKVGSDKNPAITLDKAQMLVGAGAVALLGFDPDKVYLSNSGTLNYNVTIVIGRDVTP